MKKGSFVLNVLMAGLIVIGSAGLGRADDLVVSGFVDITLDLVNEHNDKKCSDPAGNAKTTNCSELQFNAAAELDFERKQGPVTVRVDVDLPVGGASNNIAGVMTEQARFDLAVPGGESLGLNLTAGIFNSPIGFEAQDKPDMLQDTNGQLFGLVPSNIVGLRLSGGNETIQGSVIFVNDFRDPVPAVTTTVGEENSFGLTLSVTPMPILGVTVGYLDSGILPNEGLLDVVVSGTTMPAPELELLYAVEFVSDEKRDGLGLTVNASHGHHGITVRYDMVETDGSPAEPKSLTVALLCEIAENLEAILEWRIDDPSDAEDAENEAILAFVATF